MVSNNAWPLRLPQRAFGGVAFSRVAYSSAVLGPLGWLARHGKKGAVPLELRKIAREVADVFDHPEAWLRIDESGARHLDDRLLVGHPYGFDAAMRATLERAAEAFGFAWSASSTGSWYAPGAWLIIAAPRHLLPIPGDELPGPRGSRRPLRTGEYVTTLPDERVEARRLAKRAYNKARYERLRDRPMSLGEILADPERARAKIRARERRSE